MRAGLMVMTAGKDFAHALRGGIAATCEVAGLSVLGVSLAALMWTVVTPKDAMTAPTSPASSVGDTLANVVTRLSRVDDPFARGGAQAAPAGEASGFVLHAARAWDDGKGTAILSTSAGQQGAYAIGEEISPGVTLALVANDHVEIDVGGRRMRVSFPRVAAAPVIEMAQALPADYSAAARASAVPSLSALPLQPVNRDGAQAGLEVMAQADSRMLAATGLKPGDILLSVNGVSAATANPDAYRQQLLSGQPVDIRFERGGHVQSIRLGTQ